MCVAPERCNKVRWLVVRRSCERRTLCWEPSLLRTWPRKDDDLGLEVAPSPASAAFPADAKCNAHGHTVYDMQNYKCTDCKGSFGRLKFDAKQLHNFTTSQRSPLVCEECRAREARIRKALRLPSSWKKLKVLRDQRVLKKLKRAENLKKI